MKYIYGLYDPPERGEQLRYIGRAGNPWGRLKAHWRDQAKLDKQYNSPKNIWLRTLDKCPDMEILVIVEDVEVFRTENAMIGEVSRRWPGLLVNSAQNGNSPEWDATRKRAAERLASYIAANPEARRIRSETAKNNPALGGAGSVARWAQPGSREKARAVARPTFGAEMRGWWKQPEFARKMAKRNVSSATCWANNPCSLDRPCKECGTPVGVFSVDCPTCQKTKRHPYWAKQFRRG